MKQDLKEKERHRREKRILIERVLVIIRRWHWGDSHILTRIEKQILELKEGL